MLGQEFVSGSRLRAIHFVGTDGSKSPWLGGPLFWDNQLETICAPPRDASTLELASTGRCEPVDSRGFDYADSNCTSALGRPAQQLTAFGRPYKVYLEQRASDGGAAEFFSDRARRTRAPSGT